MGSIVDLINTESEARVFVSDTVCEGITELNRCRTMAKKFQKALRLTSVVIAFPHRRDIVFSAQTNDRGNRVLRVKFPATLEEFPEARSRAPPVIPELSDD
jgi:hypothetical protein